MTTLEEFSDVPRFTIKSVCTQTGIRAVTLRAWERRHEVLTPHRSENRYRLYSERDIAILRWIKSRVDSGMAISSVVNELRAMMRSGYPLEAVPAGPAVTQFSQDVAPDQYVDWLYQALRAHDEGLAGDAFREIQAKFDLLAICQKILIPCLVEIGDDWYNGRIRVTTEHFASAYVRGKLLAIFQAYPSHRSMPSILVGCAPGEQHEIGSLMAAVLLRSLGFRIEYLGPDIPLDDLVDYAGYEHPNMIILAASMESSARELAKINGKLVNLRPAPLFGFGGQAFIDHPELKNGFQGIYLGDTLEQGLAAVQGLLLKNRIA